MKRLRVGISLKRIAMAIATIALLVGTASVAQAFTEDVVNTLECKVNSRFWTLSAYEYNKLTLRQAIEMARTNKNCTERIKIAVPNIYAASPMILDDMQNVVIETDPDADFDQATINFTHMEGGTAPCAIDVRSPLITLRNLKIVDVEARDGLSEEEIASGAVVADPTHRAAVCMNASSVNLRNIDILGADGDAFVFGNDSAVCSIDYDSSASAFWGAGLRDLGSGSFNILQTSDGVLAASGSGQLTQFDVDTLTGLARWETEPQDVFRVIPSRDGVLMDSDRPYALKIAQISQGSMSSQITIRGFLMETQDANSEKIDCKSASVSAQMNLIAIFANVGMQEGNSSGATIQFMGFIGKGMSGGLGILQNCGGHFEALIDKNSNSFYNNQNLDNVQYITLVPMNASPELDDNSQPTGRHVLEIVGRATPPLLMEGGSFTDCTSGTINDRPACAGDTTYNNPSNSVFARYGSLGECQDNLSTIIGQPGDPQMDSDGDFISDLIEMGVQKYVRDGATRWVFAPMDGSCYKNNRLTIWYKADSDADGILDGNELGDGYNPTDISELWVTNCGGDGNPCIFAERLTGDDAANFTGPAWDITHLVRDSDTDEPNDIDLNDDGVIDVTAGDTWATKPEPDARTGDSDGDGVADGKEDRGTGFLNDFVENADGSTQVDENGDAVKVSQELFYPIEGTNTGYFNDPTSDDMMGDPILCDLTDSAWGGDTGEGGPFDIGVAYGVFYYWIEETDGVKDFKMKYITINEDTNATSWGGIPEGATVAPLRCQNVSVVGEHNFNGKFDSDHSETNLLYADTDGDCVCDGDGPMCDTLDLSPAQTNNPQAGNPGSCTTYSDADGNHDGDSIRGNNGLWLDDKCPRTKYFTKECFPKCYDYEYMFSLAYKAGAQEYVELTHNSDGKLIGVKFLMDGNVPKLFTEKTVDVQRTVTTGAGTFTETITVPDADYIKQLCGDHDGDGIPSCVENWDGRCHPPNMQVLNPLNPDTDGDGLLDGKAGCDASPGSNLSDVCPFTNDPSKDDSFVEGGNQYSCTAELLYQPNENSSATPVLAMFINRDCDKIPDGMEDHDQDGTPSYDSSNVVTSPESIIRTETNPLSRDTDGDGVDDYTEAWSGRRVHTNPANEDSDGDGRWDGEEDTNGDNWIDNPDPMQSPGSCAGALDVDTDPTNPDTDGDGINDSIELSGHLQLDESVILTALVNNTLMEFFTLEHAHPISHPQFWDSDGDGLSDGEEVGSDARITSMFESNPCMINSDGDTFLLDPDDPCPMNMDPTCDPSMASAGVDSDSDGLDDLTELMIGTDPQLKDSDGDDLLDGQEDINHDGIVQDWQGETDPTKADTDGDGLTDQYELKIGSDPNIPDSDGDCILDGLEDKNHNGNQDPDETHPMDMDSDDDGLPDGLAPAVGYGEDLNCNGERDVDANGNFLETSPINWDSDGDGSSDKDEVCQGSGCSLPNIRSNISDAVNGKSGFCTLMPNSTADPTHLSLMLMMLGLVLAGIARARKNLRLRKDRV